MNVEIRKVANGYLVFPMWNERDHERYVPRNDLDIYVFSSYGAMVDKLQEILEKPEER